MLMNVIIENDNYETPSQEDLALWADTYGMDLPVLADAGATEFWKYGSGGLPTIVLIDHGMVLESVNQGATESEVEALVNKYK